MPASLALVTLSAMPCASTASSTMTSTLLSIMRCIWSACLSASASALAYSTLPLLSVSDSTFFLNMG